MASMVKVGMFILVAAVAAVSCNRRDTAATADTVTDTVIGTIDTLPRTSITFILGNDHSAYNQYYTMANQYYRLNASDRTETVVDNLTSLGEVLNYLKAHPDTVYGRPYGLINLVSHGNEFIDLQMKVVPHGARTSVQALQAALNDSLLAIPDSTLVDSLTLVYLHGCAVGNNQELLNDLAEAFGGRATVMASKLFEYYAYTSPGRNPQNIKHYFAKAWYAFYNPDSTTSDLQLAAQLRHRYPDEDVDWLDGLRRRLQDNPLQLYHFTFILPCIYEETYDRLEEIPPAGSLKQRPQFRALLERSHIPPEYFQTKVYRKTYTMDDGSTMYGLKVKARAGVICLVQPLIATDSTAFAFSTNRKFNI